MSIPSLTYLLAIYWPYMAGALIVGLVAGWFSYSRPKS
jgi:hypothetical protein